MALGHAVGPAPYVFQGALAVARVPGGAAFIEGCANQPLRKIQLQSATLRAVLDNITRSDPEYTWTIRAGVVNLEPLDGTPALLRVHVPKYDSDEIADAASAITVLASSPDVVRAAKKLGLDHNVSGSALSGISPNIEPPKKPLEIHLQNVTLLQALNAIVRANNGGVWMYREAHCGSVRHYGVSFVQ